MYNYRAQAGQFRRGFDALVCWCVWLACSVITPVANAETGAVVTYQDLAPILVERCVLCHSGESASAGLRLDNVESLLGGGANGAIVVAGDPGASELVRRLRGTSVPRMPMTGPPFLSDAEIALFERWIAEGLSQAVAAPADPPAKEPPREPAAGGQVSYREVAPIFARRCAKCHAERGLMGGAPEGYRLTSYRETLSASERMRVVPGIPGASELLRRIRGQSQPRMPLDGPPYLSADEIRMIETWIAQGARDDSGEPAVIPPGAAVRLHGTLTGYWTLDDLPLVIDAGTRIDKRPVPGDSVEVRARLGGEGVRVERLRRR